MKRRIAIAVCASLLAWKGAGDAHGQDEWSIEAALPLDPTARMAALDERIAASIANVEAAESERARIEAELESLVDGRAAANRHLHERVRGLYRMTRAGALPLAGGFDALLAHLARVERLERIVRHDAQALRELRSRAEALRAETGRLTERVEVARARVSALEAQKQALEEEAHRAAVYAAAFGESLGPSGALYDAATGYGIRVVGPEPAPRSGFEAQRGQLALPLAAPRTARDATREDGRGLELEGARGDAVRAVAEGRVAFSDRHPSYGRMVILDHSDGWFSVYGGLARVDAEVGVELSRGAHLGTIEGTLFFQVRRGTRAMDARAWLGI